ncbi:HNH endonuclease [Ruminococcus albus]
MGYDEVSAGYVVHHSIENGIIQLVDQAIHSEFSHYGGVYFYE